MVDIFFTSFSSPLLEQEFSHFLKMLPDEMIKKNARFRFWNDRHSHLFGKLLLLEALSKYGFSKHELDCLQYNKYGRPYLPCSDIDFNISHSGNVVICAIAKGMKLGVDVEKITPVDFNNFKNVMNKNQWLEIKNANKPYQRFFEFWTIKESVIKADSRGLSLPLLNIHIDNEKKIAKCEGQTWYLSKLSINDDVAAFLATDNDDNLSYKLHPVNFSFSS